MTFIIDAHEDIAWNMLALGRDYLRSAAATRIKEKGSPFINTFGETLLGWEDFQRGQIGLVFGTLFAAPRKYSPDLDRMTFLTSSEARALYHQQVDAYQRLCEVYPDKFCRVLTRADLKNVLKPWQQTPSEFPDNTHPVGFLTLMEGAEGVDSPEELEEWWEAGVRMIGLVWAGTRYAGGTREPGPITPEGRKLLTAMADLGFMLDISHMSDQSVLEAVETYQGPIAASHANARSLLKGTTSVRHLTDEVILKLVQRNAVIGVIPYNRFLIEGWQKTDPREKITLQHVVNHIDHICQLAGDPWHVGLGSDFDGGFGWTAVPMEIETIADLQKLAAFLSAQGYNDAAVTAIFHGNWLRFLEESLPL